jgi:hypothetical protein
MRQIKLFTVLTFATALASSLAKIKWGLDIGYGFYDGS